MYGGLLTITSKRGVCSDSAKDATPAEKSGKSWAEMGTSDENPGRARPDLTLTHRLACREPENTNLACLLVAT
eukprot:3798364-Pleurochrysis_carterae.AAC.2